MAHRGTAEGFIVAQITPGLGWTELTNCKSLWAITSVLNLFALPRS